MSNLHRLVARCRCASGLGALVFLIAIVFWASSAQAQTINPTTVSFLPSPDNGAVDANGQPLVTSYTMEIFPLGASQPFATLDLGKPAPGPDGSITVNFASMLSSPPLPGQTLEGRVAAIGPSGTGESAWSNTFMFDTFPSVQLTSPAAGATFTAPASISLAAGASDSDGTVSRVDFYANSTLIGSATASPYAMAWSNVAAGSYALSAVATDNGGLKTESASVSVTVQAAPPSSTGSDAPPSITVTSPASGSMVAVGTAVTLGASASDSDGSISRVDFYANGTRVGSATASPYNAAWTPTAMGNYTITAVATDNAGKQTTSAGVAVKVRRKVSRTTAASLDGSRDIGPSQAIERGSAVPTM